MQPSYIVRNDGITITIPARYLKAIQQFMAKGDARYYLNGANVSQGRIEASDGHIAMRIDSPDIKVEGMQAKDNQDRPSVIISRDSIDKECRSILKRNLADTLTLHGTSVDLVDGQYPDMGRVLIEPHETSGEIGQFNPELLCRIQKAYKSLWPNKKNVGAFELHHNGASKGAVVKNSNADEIVHCVIMPWRV